MGSMTVALLGVGADSTNTTPTPPRYSDGAFEYIPIPESSETIETRTYGNSPLRYGDGMMADYLTEIRPHNKDGPSLTGAQLRDWPLHHDPNFEALTYGETTSRGAYTKVLRGLDDGDIVAFYTGLQTKDTTYRHRYIIGYFTVKEIVDFQNLDNGRESVRFGELPEIERHSLMKHHRENAHAKRFQATGSIARQNDGLVIVDGREPGERLETAIRISEHLGGGHHYLTDQLQAAFAPVPGGNPDRNAYLGGIKKAHILNISPGNFRDVLDQIVV